MNNLIKVVGELKENLVNKHGVSTRVIFHFGNKAELMNKLENFIYNVLRAIANEQAPFYEVPQNLQNVYQLSLRNDRSRRKFANITYLLSKMQQLLCADKISTKRELYYENCAHFDSQGEIDGALHDICKILEIPIWQTRIVGTAKGLIAGNVVFRMDDGQIIEVDLNGTVIPQNILEIREIKSDAKWILLVEKDAVFEKLLQDQALRRLGPCIFITGKGFPDVNSRIMVRRLWEELQVPVLALVDADPHGIAIMIVYRFGSMAMAFHSGELACPAVRWLGVHPTDISRLSIESQPLTEEDHKKIGKLLLRPDIQSDPTLKNQIQALKNGGVKAEIEGLTQFAPSYIADTYIPSKITSREII